MQYSLCSMILQLLIALFFSLIFIKDYGSKHRLQLLIFSLVFLIYKIALLVPVYFEQFNLVKSEWGWSGKVFGIVVGIISYFLFKKQLSGNNYFTLTQNNRTLRSTLFFSVLVVFLSMLVHYLLVELEFDYETLFYQLTMPGIDEEIIYRGILLGLLMNTLKERIILRKFSFGNPSILIIGILFGLVHSLYFSQNWELNFNGIAFIRAAFAGYVWSWIAVKSQSILQPILSHNLSNFFGVLIAMSK